MYSSTSSTDEFSWDKTAWSLLRAHSKPANRRLCACIVGSPSKKAWLKVSNVAFVTHFSLADLRSPAVRDSRSPFSGPGVNSARDAGAATSFRPRKMRLSLDDGHRANPNFPALRLFAYVVQDAIDLVQGACHANATTPSKPADVEAARAWSREKRLIGKE